MFDEKIHQREASNSFIIIIIFNLNLLIIASPDGLVHHPIGGVANRVDDERYRCGSEQRGEQYAGFWEALKILEETGRGCDRGNFVDGF